MKVVAAKQVCLGQSCGRLGMLAGTNARLRTKQHLLVQLLERVRDKSAFTRSAVCRAWEHLVQKAADGCGKIPIGHWIPVTCLAIGNSRTYCRTRYGISANSLGSMGHCFRTLFYNQLHYRCALPAMYCGLFAELYGCTFLHKGHSSTALW